MSRRPAPMGEERNVVVKHLVSLPESVSFETAAGMMLKGLTAQYLVRQTYRVQPGDTILVHAAAGGVGQILVQWGKALGATVIATVGSDAKAEIAKSARRGLCDQLFARRISPRASPRSPRAPNAPSSTTASARRRSRPRSIACGRSACSRVTAPLPARSRISISAFSARRARCMRPVRPCSRSSATANGWRPWRLNCSRSSLPAR